MGWWRVRVVEGEVWRMGVDIVSAWWGCSVIRAIVGLGERGVGTWDEVGG